MSSNGAFADKNEHLIIFQWFSEAGLAEDNLLVYSLFFFLYKITIKMLWVLETSGSLDGGRAAMTLGMGIEALQLPPATVPAIPILGRFGGHWTSKIFTANSHKH